MFAAQGDSSENAATANRVTLERNIQEPSPTPRDETPVELKDEDIPLLKEETPIVDNGELFRGYILKDGSQVPQCLGEKRRVIMKGFYNYNCDVQVAIVKLPVSTNEQKKEIGREVRILKELKAHENFIRYSTHEMSPDFVYLALELCLCSVAELLDRKLKNKFLMNKEILSDLPEKEILRQATRGLQYLHENNFVHRNIKPNNFLIKKLDSSVNSACRYVVKITDFRLTRRHDPENDIKLSGSAASEGWEAPESGDKTKDLSTKLDVFILGCFYHYVLTARTGNNEPKHPFGNHGVRRDNIRDTTYFVYQKNHEFVLSDQNKNVVKLIKSMLKFNEGERPELEEVLRSPYYNPSEDYKIGDKKYKKPGLCVIFNQQVFHDKTQNRGGSDKDRDKLEKTFKKLGFKIEIIENSASFDLKSDIKDLAKRDWKDYGCLVVCFLSHGIENEIMCYDGLYVNINELKYEFSLAKCPNLYGKPKIFIVQACQGELSQSETDIVYPSRNSSHAATKLLSHICDTVLFALGKWQSPSIAQSSRMEINTNRKIGKKQNAKKYPPLMDFITIKATLAGFVSYRFFKTGENPDDITYLGSSFIQALCEALSEEYLKEKPQYADLERVLKRVQVKVNEKSEKIKKWQTLESIVSLKKYIRFRKCKPEDIDPKTSKTDRKDEYHFIQ